MQFRFSFHDNSNICFIFFLLILPAITIGQNSSVALEIIKENDLTKAKSFFNKSNTNITDKEGDNLLMNAALYGSAEMMELLLKKGANPNLQNADGETALMWSLHDIEKVKLLIDKGANVNLKTKHGNTAFLIACVGSNQYELVKLLMDHGANVFERNGKKETALGRAAIFGDSATLSLLLAAGIDINAGDTSRLTPLIQAIFNVNREGTIFLLNKGADPDLVGAFGLIAISAAVTYNDLESIQAILKKSKKINAVDDGGFTALMWAAYNEHDNPDIIQALLDNGADVHIKAKNGDTAMAWAIKKGNTKTVALIKKAGGN